MNKRANGLRVLLSIGVIILVMLLAGQTMSFINYEFTVSVGLQEPFGEIGVAVNKAFGVGDTIIYLPLLFVGLIGLWQKKEWGIFAMISALAITAYWPVVCIFVIIFAEVSPQFNYVDFTSVAIVLCLISLYGIWGLFYLYKNQKYICN